MSMATSIAGAGVSDAADIAGTALSSFGSVLQHKQEKANAKMREELAEYNAKLEENEAERIDRESSENVIRARMQADQMRSAQRAMLGKSGVAMSSGSPMAAAAESASYAERQIRDLGIQAYQEAEVHRRKANMFRYDAALAKASAPSSSSLGMNIAGQWTGYLSRVGSRASGAAASINR